jgi:thioesterase domain-containing protein
MSAPTTTHPAGGGDGATSAAREALLALLMQEAEREAQQRAALPPSVVTLQPLGRQPGVFGVGVFHFRTLAQRLGTARPFYGLLGHELDEEGEYMGRVEAMAARYVEDLRTAQPEGPYHLCGFCFGGLVAYEMACQLEAAGETVGMVLLIDTYHPATFEAEAAGDERPLHRKLAAHLEAVRRDGPRHLLSWLRNRRRYEANRWRTGFRVFMGRLWRLIGRPAPDWLEGADTYRDNLAAARRYEPRPFGGEIDLVVSIPPVDAAASGGAMDLALVARAGWRPLAGAGLRVETVESDDHKDILNEPRVARLANIVADALARERPAGAPRPAAARGAGPS